MNVFPMRAEVGVIVTVLLAHLTDVVRLGQLGVEIFPLGVEDVGRDLPIRSQSAMDFKQD